MPYCPFCQSELSIDETTGERCPICEQSFAGANFEPPPFDSASGFSGSADARGDAHASLAPKRAAEGAAEGPTKPTPASPAPFQPPADEPAVELDVTELRAVLAQIARRGPEAQSDAAMTEASVEAAVASAATPSLPEGDASATLDFAKVDVAALMAAAGISQAPAAPPPPDNPAPESSAPESPAVAESGLGFRPAGATPTGTHYDELRFAQTVEIPEAGVPLAPAGLTSADGTRDDAPRPGENPIEKPLATPTGTHYDDRRSDVTVDFGSQAAADPLALPDGDRNRPAAPRSPALDSASPNDATIDSAYLGGEAGWSSIVSPGGNPRMSLKAGGGAPSHGDSKLVINTRSLLSGKQAPNRHGDYEILEVLGEGGMGVVYMARQASIDRTVAIKMLKGEIAKSRDQRDKFLSEAVVTGDLDHPNIVPIYDLGSNEAGALFYSMKRVVGTPWIKVLGNKTLAENLEILMKVADAIAFAHARGVVHRDIKPENTMLGEFGEVLVMDWGLALSTPDFRKSGSVTQTSSMGGTPAYMAPEMATGPIEAIGPAADIYLLGAVLYEIIAGKPPHSGDTVMNCLVAAARNEIEPTGHSGELLSIALKAMASNPAERYPETKDFQSAIREYESHSESIALSTRAEDDLAAARVAGDYQLFSRALFAFQEALAMWSANTRAREGISAAKLSYAEGALAKGDFDLGLSLLHHDDANHAAMIRRLAAAQRERDARKQRLKNAKRTMIGLTALVIVLVTGGLLYVRGERDKALLAERQAKADRDKAIAATDRAENSEKQARSSETAAKTSATRATLAARQAREAEGKARQAEQQARADRDLAQQAKNSEEYESYVARIGLIAAKIDENAFDKAERLLGACKPKFRNWEWGRLSYLCGQSMRSCDAGAPVDAVAWFPNEKRFVSADWDGMVKIWNAASGALERAIPYGALYVHGVAVSPDGRHVAAAGSDPKAHVKIWNADTGELERELKGHTDAALSVVYSRDGKRLLTSSYDKTARLWDVATGRELQAFQGHAWWVWSAQFSPNEKQIVTAGQDGKVIVWQTDSGEPGPPFTGHSGPVYTAAFSPDGRSVASAGYDKRILVWEPSKVKAFDFDRISSAEGNPPPVFKSLAGHAATVRCVRFSRNGRQLASASHDNTLRLWDLAEGKELKTIRGHAGWVRSCALTPDGRHLLSGSHDHSVKLWNIEGYEEQRVLQARLLEGHADAILSVHFSPDGRTVATASRDRTAKVWDVQSGRELKHFEEGHEFLASTAIFFDEGKRVLTSAADNTARVWDVRGGTQILRLERTGRSAACAVSHQGDFILTGSDTKQAKLWNAATGELARVLPAHLADVCAVAFSPDDKTIAAGDAVGHCALYATDTGVLLKRLEGHAKRIVAAIFLPDGRRLLTASSDNSVGQWDVASGKENPARALRHPDAVSGLALLPDARHCVTLCDDGLLRLWNLEDAKVVRSFGAADSGIDSLALAPDGRRVLTVSSRDRAVREWNVASGEAIAGPGGRPDLLNLKSGVIWSATYTPDGAFLLTVGGNTARMWEAHTGRPGISFSPHGAVASANFSPDGRLLVTASWDNSAKIWDVAASRAIAKLEGEHNGYVNCAVFSPDSAQVLTASDDHTAKLWDVATAKALATFTGHAGRVRSVAFSADGRRMVTASADKTAHIWDVPSRETIQVLKGHMWGVLAAAFSLDGDRVITGSEDNTARIWNPKTGETLLTLQGHTASINWVALSPDGRRALTASQDNTVKLWDTSSGKELLTLRGHVQEVTAAEFSADGRSVVTGSRDGTAIVWMSSDWRDASEQRPAGPFELPPAQAALGPPLR